jgi:hypothetical protein
MRIGFWGPECVELLYEENVKQRGMDKTGGMTCSLGLKKERNMKGKSEE